VAEGVNRAANSLLEDNFPGIFTAPQYAGRSQPCGGDAEYYKSAFADAKFLELFKLHLYNKQQSNGNQWDGKSYWPLGQHGKSHGAI
jgi:hypothetical protein